MIQEKYARNNSLNVSKGFNPQVLRYLRGLHKKQYNLILLSLIVQINEENAGSSLELERKVSKDELAHLERLAHACPVANSLSKEIKLVTNFS